MKTLRSVTTLGSTLSFISSNMESLNLIVGRTLFLAAVRPFAALAIFFASAFVNAAEADGAQDLTTVPFDRLVQTEVLSASRLANQVSQSHAAVSVVTAQDIRDYGYRTLADIIDGMRGLFTTYDRRYSYLGGRGLGVPGDYTGRIMVLVDGVAIQDNIYNQVYLGHDGLLDTELIARVEYVPGTGSVTYGNNAFLGIINIVTKQGDDFNTLQVAADVFSNGGRKTRVTLGQRFDNGAKLLLSTSQLASDGNAQIYYPYYDSLGLNRGIAQNKDGESSRRWLAKFSLDGLSVQAASVVRIKDVPVPNDDERFNLLRRSIDELQTLQLQYEPGSSSKLKSSTRVYFGKYRDGTIFQYAEFDPPAQYRRSRINGQWWGIDQKWVSTALPDHKVVFGLEYRKDQDQSFRWDFLDSAGLFSFERSARFDYASQTLSAYATDEFALAKGLTVNAGARLDVPQLENCTLGPCEGYLLGRQWSPRVAMVWQPEESTVYKLSLSRAFRLPNPSELGETVAETLRKPEQVAQAEFVLQHEISPGMRITGSVYDYRLTDQAFRRAATGERQYQGQAGALGIDAQIDAQLHGNVRARASVAWQNAKDSEGQAVVNAPRFIGKVQVSAPFWSNALRAGIEWVHVGTRLTSPQNDDDFAVVAPSRSLDAINLLNLTLTTQKKWYGLGASWGVRNLLDQRFEAAVGLGAVTRSPEGVVYDAQRMDGRSVWLQLTYDMW